MGGGGGIIRKPFSCSVGPCVIHPPFFHNRPKNLPPLLSPSSPLFVWAEDVACDGGITWQTTHLPLTHHSQSPPPHISQREGVQNGPTVPRQCVLLILVSTSRFCSHLPRLSLFPFPIPPRWFVCMILPICVSSPTPSSHLSMRVLYFLLERKEVPPFVFRALHLHTQLPPPRDQKAIEVA